jgi:hypothetical protein
MVNINNTIYVLHVMFDDARAEMWAFDTRTKAENFLRDFVTDYFIFRDVDPPDDDDDLMEAFAKTNTHVRLFECVIGGGSDELMPFQRALEAARDEVTGLLARLSVKPKR